MTTPSSPDGRLADQLRRLMAAVDASGRALLPDTNLALLQSIVDAAAHIFGAAAASVALVDDAEQMLEFKVSYGAGRDEVVGRRIPVDQGIAGYVAMTGQPIAVSNVQQDPRFGQDFAQSTGYVPRSILATPLLADDRVIGVMEVLDKINAPSFGLQDMELLGLFAQQAALAIHHSTQHEEAAGALLEGLKQLAASNPDLDAPLVFTTLAEGENDERADDLRELAQIFYAISAGGPAERKACLKILSAFGEYVRSKPSFE